MIAAKAFVLLLLIVCSMPTFSLSTSNILQHRSKARLAPLHAKSTHRIPLSIAAHESEPPKGESTIATSTFNLAKSVIGAGVLSLPSGVAFFSDEPAALIPASVICAFFGMVAAYTFSSIGNICREYDAKSFQEAWAKSVSQKSAWIISTSITALCFLASLAYSIIIGDSFTSLAKVRLVFSLSSMHLTFPVNSRLSNCPLHCVFDPI